MPGTNETKQKRSMGQKVQVLFLFRHGSFLSKEIWSYKDYDKLVQQPEGQKKYCVPLKDYR